MALVSCAAIVGFLGESAESLEPTAPASALAEAEGPLLVAENHRRSEIPHLGEAAEEVALYIHRSYRVPIQDARQLTEWALEIGEAENMDPLLILAVAGSESSFDPAARSKAGAEGLMQVMTKVHEDKFEPFGGKTAAFDPYSNMRVGAQILRQLIARTGSVTKALKWYSGAANHSTDWGYSAKVLREHSRLLVAAGGESDDAVQLSRGKRTGPSYRHNAVVKRLEFDRWKKHENKASSARVEAVSIKRGAKGEVRTAEGSLQSSEKNS